MGSAYVKQSPIQDWVEDEQRSLTLTIVGSTAITGTPSLAIYNEQTDTSATNLSSTSGTTNNVDTVTTSTIQALKGGQTYKLAITATVDGNTITYICVIGPVSFPYGTI